MPKARKTSIEFDTIAAIRKIEAEKEEKRLAKEKRQGELAKLRQEKEAKARIAAEERRLAAEEERLQRFGDDKYFRRSLIDSIAALTQEVELLRLSLKHTYSVETSEANRLLSRISDHIATL